MKVTKCLLIHASNVRFQTSLPYVVTAMSTRHSEMFATKVIECPLIHASNVRFQTSVCGDGSVDAALGKERVYGVNGDDTDGCRDDCTIPT